ncbi:MAG: hypothetical protein KDG51_19330 [Calditrichaeota bacterium]|nr:hypothetical protein [Calditrichota bacterium]
MAKLKLKIKIFLPDGTFAGEMETDPGEIESKLTALLVKYLQNQENKSGAVLDAAELLGIEERTVWRRLRKIFL